MGMIRKMNASGDTAVAWRPGVESEVRSARQVFEDAMGSDVTIVKFAGNPATTQGEIVAKPHESPREGFDPNAYEYLLMPQVAGG